VTRRPARGPYASQRESLGQTLTEPRAGPETPRARASLPAGRGHGLSLRLLVTALVGGLLVPGYRHGDDRGPVTVTNVTLATVTVTVAVTLARSRWTGPGPGRRLTGSESWAESAAVDGSGPAAAGVGLVTVS
jgi:hypothetical protein